VHIVDTGGNQPRLQGTLQRWSKSLAKLIGCKQILSEYYRQREHNIRMERLAHAFRQHHPHLILVIRDSGISISLLTEMRQCNIRTACWWVSPNVRTELMYAEASNYDRYYCIHRNLCRDGIDYLPAWSVDRNLYYPATERYYAHDVVFVGIWTPKRQIFLEALTGLDLAIVGPGWRRLRNPLTNNRQLIKNVIKPYLSGGELTRFYQEARIVININQWQASEASGTTLRVTDVPSCGAFLLTEYTPSLDDVLISGREVAIFSTPTELRHQVDYYLAHAEEREQIATAGLARMRELPTPEDRVRRIFTDTLTRDPS
jgi:spore maturation protein CgeB